MKRLVYSAAVLALVSVPAFAAKNEQTINLPESVNVGATQLPAGDYSVSWTGTGSNVQLTIVQKGHKSATPAVVTAKAVDQKVSHNGFTTNREGNVNQLEALQIGKTNYVFATAPAVGQ